MLKMLKILLSICCFTSAVFIYTEVTEEKIKEIEPTFHKKSMEQYKLYDIAIDDILNKKGIGYSFEKSKEDYLIKINIEENNLIELEEKDYEEKNNLHIEDSLVQSYSGEKFIIKNYKKENMFFSLAKKLKERDVKTKDEYFLESFQIRNINNLEEIKTTLDSTIGLEKIGKKYITIDYEKKFNIDQIVIKEKKLTYGSRTFNYYDKKEMNRLIVESAKDAYSLNLIIQLALLLLIPSIIFILLENKKTRTKRLKNFNSILDNFKYLKSRNRKKTKVINEKVKKQKIKNEMKNKEKQEEVEAEIENI
ncbi:MAG: hypothetical protein CL760_10740 [Chloroflexi bacterium]|nr:hypothetical protein [Chloroflexota bacterium]|tara:strand:- start:32697 stop:33617 length:921 start_codon:yes stop_codon:yes gene_type:complete